MKRSRVFSFIAMGAAILAFLCIFLPFYYIPEMFLYDDMRSISVFQLITQANEIIGFSAGVGAEGFLFVLFFTFPYVLAIIMAILDGLNKFVTDIIAAVFSGLVFLLQIVIHFFIMGSNSGYIGSLSAGFFLPLLLMILIQVFSILACVTLVKEKKMSAGIDGSSVMAGSVISTFHDTASNSPMILVVRGPMAGASYAMHPGEMVLIGRDPSQCHFIIDSNASISRKHCSVSFDSLMDQYRVQDFSSNGTFFGDGFQQITRNMPVLIRRGTTIFLGDKTNAFELV